eukprot:scaffold4304_cov38-Prasinocladus_malaysianus.AAC.1
MRIKVWRVSPCTQGTQVWPPDLRFIPHPLCLGEGRQTRRAVCVVQVDGVLGGLHAAADVPGKYLGVEARLEHHLAHQALARLQPARPRRHLWTQRHITTR